MPPRAKKNAPSTKTEAPSAEAPIIFFLKVSKEVQNSHKNASSVPEGMQTTEYADILKEEIVQQQFDEKVIHDIVAKIHQQTEYPAGTACFWCCHPFAWKSVLLPTHYDVYTSHYTAEGNFCSPECALAWTYADANITDSQRWLRHSLLLSLYKRTEVNRAPDKRVLRMFGGTLSIEQYRRYIKEAGAPLQIAMPPVRLYMPSINTQATTRDIKSYVSLSTEAVDKASQQLRLKRSKPVHSGVITLDKCMGLSSS